MMQLYFRNSHDQQNCDRFRAIMDEYPYVRFFLPSASKAPWHMQALIHADDEPIVLNFWPHKLKAQRQGCQSVEGEAAIYALIDEALADAAEAPFDVIESDT